MARLGCAWGYLLAGRAGGFAAGFGSGRAVPPLPLTAAAGGAPSALRTFCSSVCSFGSTSGRASAISFCIKLLCISPLACWYFLFTGDSNQATSCLSSSSVNFS
jgi:hypothetical protein